MVFEAVGPYRILEKLGAGGMGEVYLAEDSRLRRKVALKTLLASVSATPEARHRLLREARAAAALNHPNIAAVYDVLETESATHIVMEYVQGETLAARARRERLPPSLVLELGIQICEALAEAHQNGVIHRDLKPGNLVLTPRGTVKVLDFGLAKTHFIAPSWEDPSSSEFPSEDRPICGTPPYISPEHLLGKPTDARSDLYSLGVSLYELLAGRRPFEGPTPVSLAVAILNETPAPLRSLNPDVPPALEAVVARAMAREPESRYASATELRSALEEVALGSSAVRTASFAGRTSGRGSPRGPIVAVAAVLVTLAVGTLFLRSDAGKAVLAPRRTVPVVVVLPFANLSADQANDYLGVGLADFLTTSLARLPGVNVVSRSAAVAYHDRKLDTSRIARDLGADFIVDGAVQRSDDKIRVTLSILRAGSQVLSWSHAYDGALHEVLSLQREVADALAAEMNVTLSAADRRRVEAPPTSNAEAMADYAQGLSFLERPDVRGNVDRAIGLFRSAITRDPQFASALAGLGRAYWAKYGETKDEELVGLARATTERAVQLQPDDVAVRLALVRIESGTGRTAEAQSLLAGVLAVQAYNDEAHRLLARLLTDQGKFQEALSHLDKALEIRPTFPPNVEELAWTLFLAGRLEEAAKTYRRVTELQPDNAWAFQMLGSTEHALGRPSAAISNYRKAVALGQDARAYANLGLVYFEEKQFTEARTAYEQAARLEPGLAAVQAGLGDCYGKLGLRDKARESYRLAARLAEEDLRTNPTDGDALASLALYFAKLGDAPTAHRYASDAARQSPSSASVNYQVAAALAILGDRAAALASLKRAFELGYSRALAEKDEDLGNIRSYLDDKGPMLRPSHLTQLKGVRQWRDERSA